MALLWYLRPADITTSIWDIMYVGVRITNLDLSDRIGKAENRR